MAIAEIILKYIWMFIFLVLIVSFWPYLKKLFDILIQLLEKWLKEAEKFEFEIFGQRISINLAKGITKAFVKDVKDIGDSSEDKENKIEKIASDTERALEIISKIGYEISEDDLAVLKMFKDVPLKPKNLSFKENASITKLMNFGVLEYDSNHGSGLRLSSIGIHIKNMLHEISPWSF